MDVHVRSISTTAGLLYVFKLISLSSEGVFGKWFVFYKNNTECV